MMKNVLLASLMLYAITAAYGRCTRFCDIKKLTLRVRPRCCRGATAVYNGLRVRICYTCCARGSRPYRGKRSLDSQNTIEAGFPCKFSLYDRNNDGAITLSEFATAIEMSVNDPKVTSTFAKLDLDKNNVISCEELKNGPIEFDQDCTAGEPECD